MNSKTFRSFRLAEGVRTSIRELAAPNCSPAKSGSSPSGCWLRGGFSFAFRFSCKAFSRLLLASVVVPVRPMVPSPLSITVTRP